MTTETYIKRGYAKTYDENGQLISKVPVDAAALEAAAKQEEIEDEMVESGNE